jgi:hypothetical protein
MSDTESARAAEAERIEREREEAAANAEQIRSEKAKAQKDEEDARLNVSTSVFAGVWFSDTGVCQRTVNVDDPWYTSHGTGVVAVSGVVPLLCCKKDLDEAAFSPGDRVYLSGAYRPYLQPTITDYPAGVPPRDRVCEAITGEYSHQQLAVGAVSTAPPNYNVIGAPTEVKVDVSYGIPQFAPVIFNPLADNRGLNPAVRGPPHFTIENVENSSYEDDFDGGFKVFGICREENLRDVPVLRERLFIGTFVERLGASGAMVNLGAALVH